MRTSTLWRRRGDDTCYLCGERQSLIHVLNTCVVALRARRFNTHHDAVLEIIATTISAHLQPSERMSLDLSEYLFPQHIAATTLGPDIVLWDDAKILIELTVQCMHNAWVVEGEREREEREGERERERERERETATYITYKQMKNPKKEHIGMVEETSQG